MTDIRAAAQRLLTAIDVALPHAPPLGEFDCVSDAAADLRAALAEHYCDTNCTWADHAAGCVRAEPTGKQSLQVEPVAWKDKFYESLHHQDFGNSIPLYAAPPQHLPLTDEEISKVAAPFYGVQGFRVEAFARAIEAAHGIKE